VREAIEEGQWQNANAEIMRAAAAIQREAALVSSLAVTLGGA
jgi:hypothetical protein